MFHAVLLGCLKVKFQKQNPLSRLDWNNADQECRKEDMALLSVESQEEDRLINSHIKATPGKKACRL